MERIQLSETGDEEAARRATHILRRGGVILYPTSTLYGLGADALSNEAVERIYRIKVRDLKKPMHSLVSDLAMAGRYGVLDERALSLMRLEGALSLIVPKKANCKSGICRGIDTFGFRISQHSFCVQLLRAFNAPVTTTSANRAGRLPESSVDAILDQLGDRAQYIDLVIDAGELPQSMPSTLVDLSGAEPHILREGAVPTEDVRRALGV